MLSEIGALTLVLDVSLPSPGNTFGTSVSLRRYCSCALKRVPVPPRPPAPPKPCPPKPPGNPPRPPRDLSGVGATVFERFCVNRTLIASDEVCAVVDTWLFCVDPGRSGAGMWG